MKILFSADWHIKLNTKNIPNEWSINRYNLLFERTHALESKVCTHIIGGDLFDRLPTMEELELYFKFVEGCTIETIIYPGNHEALKRNTSFLSYLKTVTNRINPLVRIVDNYETLEFEDGSLVDILPYNKLKEYEKDRNQEWWPSNKRILCTHVRGEIPPHVKPEVDLDIFNDWDVVLAGDLHSYENSQRNILYPGSPVTTSFHRNTVGTGVIIFDTNSLEHEWIDLQLPQLLRKTVKVGEELVAGEYHHIIYEVEGDLSELGAIEDNELLDKRVVKRDTDVALMLEPEMTLEEEVVEYMRYILQVPEATIDAALKEFHDNIKGLANV